LPSLALADEELVLAFPGEDDAPDVELDCLVLLPFWVAAPEESVPLDFPAGCGGADAVLPAALELLELPLLTSVPEAPAGPVVVVAVCCWAGEELAEACGGGTLAGGGALASSSTANGLVSTAWVGADAAADSEGDETAVEALCAILGTLGTVGDSGSDNNNDGLLATGRPPVLSEESLYKSICYNIWRWPAHGKLFAAMGKICRIHG
jgi:hypothetical protein